MMKALPIILILSFLSSFSVPSASAQSVDTIVAELTRNPLKEHKIGELCERLAYRKVSRGRFAHHRIYTNMEYSNSDGKVLGEIDFLGLKDGKEVMHIGEAKCWNSFTQGRDRALEQMKRFRDHVKNLRDYAIWEGKPCVVNLVSQDRETSLTLRCSAFNLTQYVFYHPRYRHIDTRNDIGFTLKAMQTILDRTRFR